MALAQAKKVERESRISKQQIAKIRDLLQAQEATSNEQGNTSKLEEG